MPTIEERREVARRLRETSDEIRYWYDTNPYWYVMKCIYGDVKIHDDNELFYRLADLIKPEPERTCYDDGNIDAFRCDKCGAFAVRSLVTDCTKSIPIRYCPNCGAKVIVDGN